MNKLVIDKTSYLTFWNTDHEEDQNTSYALCNVGSTDEVYELEITVNWRTISSEMIEVDQVVNAPEI